MAKTITAYVVHHRSWNYDDEVYFVDGTLPQKTFLSAEKAEAYRKTLEPEARCFDNPFEVIGMSLEEWTSLSKEELDEGLRKLKLDPPDHDDYYAWWREDVENPTKKQLHGVYDLLDLVTFYEVVPTEITLED